MTAHVVFAFRTHVVPDVSQRPDMGVTHAAKTQEQPEREWSDDTGREAAKEDVLGTRSNPQLRRGANCKKRSVNISPTIPATT